MELASTRKHFICLMRQGQVGPWKKCLKWPRMGPGFFPTNPDLAFLAERMWLNRPGPSLTQARFLEIWKSGTWTSGILGSKKIQKITILKIQIRSAQSVGKVWISRKKSSWPQLGPSGANFSMDWKNIKNQQCLPIFLGESKHCGCKHDG